MMSTTARWMPAAVVLVAVLSTACTGGQVTMGGAPMAGAEVSIWICDQTEYITTTDATGAYQFNPYDPVSPAFDSNLYIPQGPIAIEVNAPAGQTVVRRQHVYDATCPIEHDGSTQDLPCKIHAVNFVPMTPIDVLLEFGEFLAYDCGASLQQAEDGAIDMARRPQLAEPSPLGAPSEVTCLTACADSCVPGGLLAPDSIRGELPGDLAACMCSCAATSCGTSFSAFCSSEQP